MRAQENIGGFNGQDGGYDSAGEVEASGLFLIFRVGRFTLALPIHALKRVHDAEGLPPRTPGSRVLDLYQLVGEKADKPTGYWIDMEVGEKRYLMPVEQVEEIRELSLALPMAYPEALRGPDTEYLKTLYFDGLRMIAEIDPALLAQSSSGSLAAKVSAAKKKPGAGSGQGEKEKTDSGGGPERVIYIETAGKVLAIGLGEVVQIMNRDDIHPVPSGGRKVSGVVYWSDKAVPVFTASDLLEGDFGKGEDDFSLILIMETDRGLVGFGCDRVIQVGQKMEGVDQVHRPYLSGLESEAIEITSELLIERLR